MLELGFFLIFPNICVAFRIFLTLPVSVATAERPFSMLKNVKNFHCSTMSQERLKGLAVLNINTNLVRRLDFSSIITTFAATNVRKAFLQLKLILLFFLIDDIGGRKCVIYKWPQNIKAAWASLSIEFMTLAAKRRILMLSLELDL